MLPAMKRLPVVLFALTLLAGSARAQDTIVINEIMYNSPGTDVEFIELYNRSAQSQVLDGWYVLDDSDDHEACMITATVAAGGYLVVAADLDLFQQVYPDVSALNPQDYDPGETGWGLGNSGDTVRLFNSSGELHDEVYYEDGGEWPSSPDGDGPSLELLNPSVDNDLPTSWDPSQTDGGTPGAENSVYALNIEPVCKDGERNIDLPTDLDEVLVTVYAFDYEDLSQVELFVDTGSGFVSQQMWDDGSDGDVAAGDTLYTGIIAPQSDGTVVRYYALATDELGQLDYWPSSAPDSYRAYTVNHTPPDIRISEVLAVNDATLSDENGEFDDWFEICNAGDVAVDLEGMFVSTSLSSSRSFELPALSIEAGAYMLFWADEDLEQGDRHVDFKLGSGGEAVAIFESIDKGNVLIDGWKFGIMSADIPMGLYPLDATEPEYLDTATPGASNDSAGPFSMACINEFQSTSDFGGPDDWVEIFNRGEAPFDLSGCFLSDQRGDNTKWTFPDDTVLEPGEYLLIFEDVLDFGFSSEGDDVIMFSAADTTTGLDFYDFGPQQADVSEGRYPDGSGFWYSFTEPTAGSTNADPTTVDEPAQASVSSFHLHENYPNPFNPQTRIRYTLMQPALVEVKIYNSLGKLVRQLPAGQMAVGTHEVIFLADDLSSGVYYYSVKAGNINRVRKMLLVK